ncbi:hypothetical protein JCM3766R1_005966 [Sporobolomyces carnicolor]
MTSLFDASLLTEFRSLVPEGLDVRPLERDDYARGHLELLAHLTQSPDSGVERYRERFDELRRVNDVSPTYFSCVLVDTTTSSSSSSIIVGHATLVVERKFLRNLGQCGHVEDVVVDPRVQGKRLGQTLLKVLTGLSERLGCYKTILDCDPKNEAFYLKCGYENKGCEMAKYADKK